MSKADSTQVKKEQLLTEHQFLEFCAFDFARKKKLYFREEFLWAAMKDGFLKPLLKTKEKVPQEDGAEKEVLQSYYSPHQIYILTELENNVVDEGLLRSTDTDIEWSKLQGFRYVSWGSSSLNIDAARGSKMPKELDIFSTCKHFHNFLNLLHSLPQKETYDPTNKGRHFTDSPNLEFDFSSLKTKGAIVLKNHSLNIFLLRFLKARVGVLATEIDPLEYWYYYVKLHPRWRKDLFKGRAALAQDLYIICEFIDNVLEAVTGEASPPLLEFLHPDITPFLLPKTEYAKGTDLKAIQNVIGGFKEWASKQVNKPLVDAVVWDRLKSFEERLADYEKRYGDKSYPSGIIREVEIEEKLDIDSLDPKAKSYVGKVAKQPYTREVKRTIAIAIERSLDDLRRELWELLDEPGKILRDETSEAWRIVNDFGQWFWLNIKSKNKELPRVEEQKLYEKEFKKAQKNAAVFSDRREEFGTLTFGISLVFCINCRKKPVQLHSGRGDQQIFSKPICDDCVKNTEDPKTIKEAELKCDYCGNMLYKYAYQNRLNDLIFNKAPADIDVELEYGRLQIRVKCKNCKNLNRRWVDWGWTA